MIKSFQIFCLLFIGSICFCQDNASWQDNGTIKLSSTEVNFGKIKRNSNGHRKILITNIGKTTLHVNKCSGSCGCTVPSCPSNPILPGKSDYMNIRYNTDRVGVFSKNITLWSSDAMNPIVVVKVFGEVLEE